MLNCGAWERKFANSLELLFDSSSCTFVWLCPGAESAVGNTLWSCVIRLGSENSCAFCSLSLSLPLSLSSDVSVRELQAGREREGMYACLVATNCREKFPESNEEHIPRSPSHTGCNPVPVAV